MAGDPTCDTGAADDEAETIGAACAALEAGLAATGADDHEEAEAGLAARVERLRALIGPI